MANSTNGNILSLMRIVQTHAEVNKCGITILADLSCFFNDSDLDGLLKYEISVPLTFKDISL